MKFDPIKSSAGGIEIAPMVDLVFLLLIFFMIGARLSQPVLELDLPQGKSGSSPQGASLVLSVDRQGQSYLQNKHLTLSELKSTLRREIEARPETRVTLKADSSIRYGQFMAVLDATREAGVINLDLEYRPE